MKKGRLITLARMTERIEEAEEMAEKFLRRTHRRVSGVKMQEEVEINKSAQALIEALGQFVPAPIPAPVPALRPSLAGEDLKMVLRRNDTRYCNAW